MKNVKRFALWSTIATYFLIFVGGLVRVSGAGLGCPDWPKCFGRWIPPTSVDQLPPDIDPNLFNFTLAWIEYINRLVGLVVGLLIAITAIFAIRNARHVPRILVPSILAALLVAFQGWQGGQVVYSALEPFTLSIHLGLALLIVSLMVYVSQQAYYLDAEPLPKDHPSRSVRVWVAGFWILSLFQILMGTQIRSELQLIQEQFPLLSGLEWLARVGPINTVHTIFGIILMLYMLYITYRISSADTFNRSIALILSGIMILQLIIGFILIYVGLPELIQLLHLWLASLSLGGVLFLFNSLAYNRSTS